MDVLIEFHDADIEKDQLDTMLGSLMRDLGATGAIPSRVSEGQLPKNAKGDAFTLGALAIAALPTVLPQAIVLINEWVVRAPRRRIRIKGKNGVEIEFTSEKPLSEKEVLDLARRISAIK
ncbi:hypothetical protein [Sorangium sp. So ce128]|uniref:hypothetical protein n=1 Tax=Sorangium sp. So ce128 TaxID=3133281 RepID=UPI003F5EAD7C